MVERKEYLEQLIGWKEEQVIKVVTGIRRCGKSTLLMQYQAWLRENGALDAQIVSVNFEELEYEELLDYKKLYAYLKERLVAGKTTYIFLDEIQKVPDFEKVVDSLYVKPNVDIYITGSNAYLLSGDLATLLTGRYVEIRMLPLSFQEFLAITELDAERGLAEYLRNGALPYVAKMSRTPEKVETYLEGIYNTVIVKDIEDRQARKESNPSKRKITDIALLKTIAKYLASVVGSPVSIRSITDYLISSGRKISPNTVNDYVEALTESFIFYHHRMDPETPLEETMGALDQIVKSGKALYVGLSNYDGETMKRACEILTDLKCPFIINQNSYNIFNRTIEQNGLKQAARECQKGIISFSPLAQGMLTDRYINGIPEDSRIKTDGRFLNQEKLTPHIEQIKKLNDIAAKRGETLAQMALKWVVKDDDVTSVLVGASKPQQILENLKVMEGTGFSEEELRMIDEIVGV